MCLLFIIKAFKRLFNYISQLFSYNNHIIDTDTALLNKALKCRSSIYIELTRDELGSLADMLRKLQGRITPLHKKVIDRINKDDTTLSTDGLIKIKDNTRTNHTICSTNDLYVPYCKTNRLTICNVYSIDVPYVNTNKCSISNIEHLNTHDLYVPYGSTNTNNRNNNLYELSCMLTNLINVLIHKHRASTSLKIINLHNDIASTSLDCTKILAFKNITSTVYNYEYTDKLVIGLHFEFTDRKAHTQ